MDGFVTMEFLSCSAVIEGIHIPILAPDHLAKEYINRKGYFSMVLQVLVDHSLTDITWYGQERCMTCASSGTQVCSGSCKQGLFPNCKVSTDDVETLTVILGDPAYPLLMKPYAVLRNSIFRGAQSA